MNAVTDKNIATVIGGLNEYFQRILQTAQFTPGEFVNLMESKFEAAGYRTAAPPPFWR